MEGKIIEMPLNKEEITRTRPVSLHENAASYLFGTMLERMRESNEFWLVGEPADGKAFICVHPVPAGHLCTHVREADLIPA